MSANDSKVPAGVTPLLPERFWYVIARTAELAVVGILILALRLTGSFHDFLLEDGVWKTSTAMAVQANTEAISNLSSEIGILIRDPGSKLQGAASQGDLDSLKFRLQMLETRVQVDQAIRNNDAKRGSAPETH